MSTPVSQLPLNELLARFLASQTADRKAGIAEVVSSDVQPHEAAFAPMVEPRIAWEEAELAPRMLAENVQPWHVKPPTEWTMLATAHEGWCALPMAAGHFPQQVKDLPSLAREKPRSRLIPKPRMEFSTPGLSDWVAQGLKKNNMAQAVMGIGALRVAQRLDEAQGILDKIRRSASAEWQNTITNEDAALSWCRGEGDSALSKWQSLPPSAPSRFNCGMALLFLDRPKDSREQLQQAVQLVPEDSAWHHLGRLYLTLTEM
jgi:tetratricopeptide (TPR) repeat protein